MKISIPHSIKILSSLATAALFSACGSNDPEPPKLVTANTLKVAPYDTIKVSFSEALDSGSVNKGITITPDDAYWSLSEDKKTILIWGENRYLDHKDGNLELPIFQEKTEYKVSLENLESTDGADQEGSFVIQAKVNSLIDNDYQNEDKDVYNDEKDAVELLDGEGKFINGETFGESQSFSGVISLDFYENIDIKDWYKIQLNRNDSLKVVLTAPSTENLSLALIGPELHGQPLKWDETKGETTAEQVVEDKETKLQIIYNTENNISRHEMGLGDDDSRSTMVTYWIRVKTSQNEGAPLPYTITLSGKD